MRTNFTFEDEATGEEWDLGIKFTCSRGCLPSYDYPGDPAELDWEVEKISVTVADTEGLPMKVAPPAGTALFAHMEKLFTDAVDSDDRLRERLEEKCWEETYDEPDWDDREFEGWAE